VKVPNATQITLFVLGCELNAGYETVEWKLRARSL